MTKTDVIRMYETGSTIHAIAEAVATETGIPVMDAVHVVQDVCRQHSERQHAGCWRRVPAPGGEWQRV